MVHVLSVIRVPNFEEGLRVANSVKYGLSSSVYTNNSGEACYEFIDRIETRYDARQRSYRMERGAAAVWRHESHRRGPARDGQRGHRFLYRTQGGLYRLQVRER